MMRTIRRIARSALVGVVIAVAATGLSARTASASVSDMPFGYTQDTGSCASYGYGMLGLNNHYCGFPEVWGLVPTAYSEVVYRYNRVWSWNGTTPNWVHAATSPWMWIDCSVTACLGVRDLSVMWVGGWNDPLTVDSYEAVPGEWVITETHIFEKVSSTEWEEFVLWTEYDGNGAFVTGGQYRA
jgi:hypothetical protein